MQRRLEKKFIQPNLFMIFVLIITIFCLLQKLKIPPLLEVNNDKSVLVITYRLFNTLQYNSILIYKKNIMTK